MIPLGKALHIRTGKDYLLYVLSIVAGATITHSLVPPTPGPLAVAELLHVNLGMMIAAGCIVGAICTAAGYLFALWINRRVTIPLRETAGTSLDELKTLSERSDADLPPTWLALLPILLPIVLITGNEILKSEWKEVIRQSPAAWQAQVVAVTDTLGNKNISLLMAAAVAVAALIWKRGTSRAQLAKVIEECVMDAGAIILVTAAGGAFGGALQHTGIAERISQVTPESHAWLLPMALLLTAAIRTAQGSSTVAMLTAGGVFQALATSTSEPLSFHPVYLAVAIGCGSKVIPWMNDSGFWVITRMSGMHEGETLRTQSPMVGLMGCVGIVTTMLGAWLFPLV
jgi:GntP family gluconate:H+ symporter